MKSLHFSGNKTKEDCKQELYIEKEGIASMDLIENPQRLRPIRDKELSVSGNKGASARKFRHINFNSSISNTINKKGNEKLRQKYQRSVKKNSKVKVKNISFIRKHSKNEERSSRPTMDNLDLLSEHSRAEILTKK